MDGDGELAIMIVLEPCAESCKTNKNVYDLMGFIWRRGGGRSTTEEEEEKRGTENSY